MQYACLLRLGHLSRPPPTRHHRLRQLLLPHTTFRTSHGLSEGRAETLEKTRGVKGQPRAKGNPDAGRVQDQSSPSRLHRAKQTRNRRPGHKSESSSNGRPKSIQDLMAFPENHSILPRLRVQFGETFDQDDDVRKLLTLIYGFKSNEKSQKKRLRELASGVDREKSLSSFYAWKNALKDFQPEPSQSRSMSISEAKYIKWFQDCATLDEMLATWPRLPLNTGKAHKEDIAQVLISAAVRHVPDKVHMVFEAALSSPHASPSWYIVEDVVELLATRLPLIRLEKVKVLMAQNLAEMTVRILNSRLKGTVRFSQITICSILAALPADFVENWYIQLHEAGCDLRPRTEVRFANRLARLSATRALSAEVLIRLQKTKLVDINSTKAARVVTLILSFSKKDLETLDEDSATPADLFRDLHSVGLAPNVITYTTIIRGLCLKNDLRTALNVFEVMQQHGVEPNEWTYSTLLNGCKMRKDWTAFVDIAIKACHANVREKIVWNEVLHAIYICTLGQPYYAGKPRRALLYALNSFYSRIFDATPVAPFITGRLAEMGEHSGQKQWFPEPMRHLITEIPPLPPLELVSPGSDTLSILLLGLIRALPLPYDVVVFYSQYRQMLRQGHPAAKRMVQERGSFVHDVVLRNLVKWPGTLHVILDIIKDMLSDSVGKEESTTDMAAPSVNDAEFVQKSDEDAHPDSPSSSKPRQPNIPHPAPSIYTWTIVVHGFMKAKRPQDAEYILTLMRNNGIEPNRVTWNTLVAGYATMQKIPEAVNAMRRLEAEGHKADNWTMRAFSYIEDKAKAIELMEATLKANKAQMEKDQQEALSRDEGAAGAEEAVEQKLQEGVADYWPPQYEEVLEQEEELLLDQGLEARLDLSLDKPGLEAILAADSRRNAEEASKRERSLQELAKSAPVEGKRYDIEGWQKVKEHGLDIMHNEPDRTSHLSGRLKSLRSWANALH